MTLKGGCYCGALRYEATGERVKRRRAPEEGLMGEGTRGA